MAIDHPIEALLRPVVEIQAGLIAAGCGAIAVMGPHWFLMTPAVATGAAVLLGGVSLFWFWRGVPVIRYQRNLRRLKRFSVKEADVPVSDRGLYIGKGFQWGEKHTQRLHDTRRSKASKYVEQGPLWQWVRRAEVSVEGTWLHTLSRSNSRFNPFRPLPDGGGITSLHGVELKERDISLPLSDRTGHTLVLGTTRVGKSASLLLMARQDILRGDVVIIIDPKGDADLLCGAEQAARDAGREFILFHLGFPERSARYNAIGNFNRITEVASRTTGQLSGEGQSAVFREFAWRFVNIVASALSVLGEVPNYKTILKHVTHIDDLVVSYATEHFKDDERFSLLVKAKLKLHQDTNYASVPRHLVGRDDQLLAVEAALSEIGETDDILRGLRSATKYDRTYFDKIVASLLPLLEKLTSGKTSQLLSPDYLSDDEDREIFTWTDAVRRRAVVYIGLDALSDAMVASAVGNAMFADLVSFTGERYKRGDSTVEADTEQSATPRKICLHADEFNELMGDEFIPMVNKGGGSGLQVTAYTQTMADVEARVGSQAKAQQVMGNFNNLIMFRVKGIHTAAILTDQLPSVSVDNLTWLAGYNDSSDVDSGIEFSSRHEDRVTTVQSTMLEPHDAMKLPRGHAFLLIEGGILYKVRLPLVTSERADTEFSEIVESMAQHYRTGENWWLSDAVQ